MEIHVEAANADMLPKGCYVSGFNLLTGFWRVARLRSSWYTYWGIDFFIKVYEIDFQVLDGKLSLLLLADWTTYRIFFRAQDPWQTKILGEYLWAFYIGYNNAGRNVRQNFPWRFWQRDSCALGRYIVVQQWCWCTLRIDQPCGEKHVFACGPKTALTKRMFFPQRLGWGWGVMKSLNLHAWSILLNVGVVWGWGAKWHRWTCTHVWCYVTCGAGMGWRCVEVVWLRTPKAWDVAPHLRPRNKPIDSGFFMGNRKIPSKVDPTFYFRDFWVRQCVCRCDENHIFSRNWSAYQRSFRPGGMFLFCTFPIFEKDKFLAFSMRLLITTQKKETLSPHPEPDAKVSVRVGDVLKQGKYEPQRVRALRGVWQFDEKRPELWRLMDWGYPVEPKKQLLEGEETW